MKDYIIHDGNGMPKAVVASDYVSVLFRDRQKIEEIPARQLHWWHDGRDEKNDVVEFKFLYTAKQKRDAESVVCKLQMSSLYGKIGKPKPFSFGAK